MIRKFDADAYEPSWTEVILGAILSLALGAILGAALLMVRPVSTVKALPKESERDSKVVYYIEGTKDTTRGREAPAKRQAFLAGQSVTLTEDHLNALVSLAPAPAAKPAAPAPKEGEKGKAADGAAPAESGKVLTVGTPNFRIADNRLQVAMPVTLDVFGWNRQAIAQARGGFVKRGDVFVYEPSEILIGSCPVHRIPYLGDRMRAEILGIAVPDDVKAAWAKLANVTVEDRTLKLTMP